MYQVDERDEVRELTDVPQSSVGAPCPVVLASESSVYVAYFLRNVPSGWDGTSVRVLSPESATEPVGVTCFLRARAHLLGPPNDEAFAGHPLASRGLRPYTAHEILHSSWIRTLERMNSVHRSHRPEMFARYRHFVWAFHDSTFECVAHDYEVSSATGSLIEVVQGLAAGMAD